MSTSQTRWRGPKNLTIATHTPKSRCSGCPSRPAGRRSSRRRPSPDIAKRIDDALERDRSARTRSCAERAAARLRACTAVGRADRLAGGDDREDRLRQGPERSARHPRPHLRVLHQGVRARRGTPRRRVLHARAGRPAARRDARAVRGPSLRSRLRVVRTVRAVGKVRRGARRASREDLGLRPGAKPGDVADRPHEPRDPRPLRRRASTPRAARCSTTPSHA